MKGLNYSWLLLSIVWRVLGEETNREFLDPPFGTISFPVGWRNISLCYATLYFDRRDSKSLKEQARISAQRFCYFVPFESMVNFGDDIQTNDIANGDLWCKSGIGLPTVMIDAGPNDSSRECASCARTRCVQHVSMALLQRALNTVIQVNEEDDVMATVTRQPDIVLPRQALPKPQIDFFSSSLIQAPFLGSHRQNIKTPLRVILWPRLFDSGFFRERKIVKDGIQDHPNLELKPEQEATYWEDAMKELYGEGLPTIEALEGESGAELSHKFQTIRSRRKEIDRHNFLNDYLEADVVIWVTENPGPPSSGSKKLSVGRQRSLALLDPRGLVPASRLVIVDLRDGGSKASPSTYLDTSSIICQDMNCRRAELHDSAISRSNFIRNEKCALYLERLWTSRHDGVFRTPDTTMVLPSYLHRVIDFTISDEFLPSSSYDGTLTTALPYVSLFDMNGDKVLQEEVEAKAWGHERPLKLVCLVRPSANMPCRIRVIRWVAELCLEKGLNPEECFVGQWSDALRTTFDPSYYNLMRRAQIVVTQKPCSWYGDYRTYEALASGAMVVMDPPGDELVSMQHGVHALYFDATDEVAFKDTVRGALGLSLIERYRIARDGHLFALTYHRSVTRMDFVFSALTQIWSTWPLLDFNPNLQ